MTAAAAFSVAAILGVISFGSRAEASNSLLSCHGDTARKVVDCCKHMTLESKPRWMLDQGISCNDAVACRKGGPNKVIALLVVDRCYFKRLYDNHSNDEGGGKLREREAN